MKLLVLASTFVFLFYFGIATTHGSNALSIINPPNNATITDTSPKLEWEYSEQCPQEGSCFRVEVAKSESFSELEKSTYTNNKYYSPSLSEGIWFWRIKAKNSQNNWSNYIYSSFSITTSQSSITPIQTPIPSPSSSSSEKSSPEFTITSSATQFTADSIAKISIKITGVQPNINYFLKAAFFKEGKTNYFGKTKVNGSWIKNNATYADQYKFTSGPDKNWQGDIEIQIDTEDSGYEGSGEYLLKVGRYTNTGSGPVWSNTIPVTIQAEKPSTKKETSTENTEEKSNKEESSLEIATTSKELVTNTLEESTVSPKPTIAYSLPNLESSVAGESTSSDQIKVLGEKRINWWFVTSGVILLVLTTILIARIQKKSNT